MRLFYVIFVISSVSLVYRGTYLSTIFDHDFGFSDWVDDEL